MAKCGSQRTSWETYEETQSPVATREKKAEEPGPNYKNNRTPKKVAFSALASLMAKPSFRALVGTSGMLRLWTETFGWMYLKIVTQDFHEPSTLAAALYAFLIPIGLKMMKDLCFAKWQMSSPSFLGYSQTSPSDLQKSNWSEITGLVREMKCQP